MSVDWRPFTIRVELSLWRRIRRAAAERDTNVGALVRELLNAALPAEPAPPPAPTDERAAAPLLHGGPTVTTTPHTPGPWRLLEPDLTPVEADERAQLRIDSPGDWDGLAYANVAPGCGAEAIANARLIAAAPELLALLEEFVECDDPRPELGELLVRAGATIKKARGKP